MPTGNLVTMQDARPADGSEGFAPKGSDAPDLGGSDASERSHPTWRRPSSRRARARHRTRLLNAEVDHVTMDELLERREGTILTLHVQMLAMLQEDPEFYRLLHQFDVVTCDSQILYFFARLRRTGLPERVSGSDYFPAFYQRWADDPEVTIFLLGAMEGVGARAAERINAKVGREIVVGVDSPPFGFMDDPAEIERIIAKVNASGATVLVVGLGAGLQERFIMTHRDALTTAKLFLPLGGTIDYESGEARRPPAWVTDVGMEWLWRVALDPKRRWHRYFVVQPPMLWQLVRQVLGRYRDPFAGTV